MDRGLIVVKNPKADDSEPPKTFSFDAVFDENVQQKYVYDVCASSVVESVLNGYNGTIFACEFKASSDHFRLIKFLTISLLLYCDKLRWTDRQRKNTYNGRATRSSDPSWNYP